MRAALLLSAFLACIPGLRAADPAQGTPGSKILKGFEAAGRTAGWRSMCEIG